MLCIKAPTNMEMEIHTENYGRAIIILNVVKRLQWQETCR